MTKIKFSTLVIIFFVYSLSAQEFFEGELNYKIQYELIDKNIPAEFLEIELGKSFTAYVQEDRYAMIYHAKGQQGWMKVIVRLDQGYSYTEFEKLDTITKSKFGKEINELIKFKRNPNDKRKILGENCESITLQYKSKEIGSPFQEIRGKYYFNPIYRLNANLYSEYTDGFWNLFVKESGAISIRNEIEFYPIFKAVQEATSITQKKVDKIMFEPNKNKVIKIE